MPICGGQIGVAVLERRGSDLRPPGEFSRLKNVLAVPDLIRSDIEDLRSGIEERLGVKFEVFTYSTRGKEARDPADLDRAKIIHEMHSLELQAIQSMIRSNLIGPRRILPPPHED